MTEEKREELVARAICGRYHGLTPEDIPDVLWREFLSEASAAIAAVRKSLGLE